MPDTHLRELRRPLFFVLVLLAAYLSYLILGPFLVPLIWATTFGILFHRMQARLAPRLGPNRAALVSTLVVAFAIIGPAVMLVAVVVREAPQVIGYLQQTSLQAPEFIERTWGTLKARSPVALPEDPGQLLTEGLRRVLEFLLPRAGGIIADVVSTLGQLLMMLFALFFMLRDGDAMSARIRALLPLPEEECDSLMMETRDLVIASVGAGLVVAAAQGAIGGLAFWLIGIRAAVFWGVVIAFCSLIPIVGSALVWLPAALALLLSGEIGRGIAMLVVGIFGIGLADNILRPLLLSGRTSISGLVIFFGLLGGVATFGFVGLVIGPIILVITGRLLELLSRPRSPAI
jgi:predicted PurR-regulated permease PerM